jgi:hypothetical protein
MTHDELELSVARENTARSKGQEVADALQSKRRFSEDEEVRFFFLLGYRFFATTLRGNVMGHRRAMSAARDYLHVDALDGLDREAAEFLVDVANSGRGVGYLSFDEIFQKWAVAANWRPELVPGTKR